MWRVAAAVTRGESCGVGTKPFALFLVVIFILPLKCLHFVRALNCGHAGEGEGINLTCFSQK